MPQLSPYFRALSKRPRPCPRCGGRLSLEALELTWDGAVWRCPECKWFALEQAPEAAKLGPRSAEDVRAKPRGRIISVDFGRCR